MRCFLRWCSLIRCCTCRFSRACSLLFQSLLDNCFTGDFWCLREALDWLITLILKEVISLVSGHLMYIFAISSEAYSHADDFQWWMVCKDVLSPCAICAAFGFLFLLCQWLFLLYSRILLQSSARLQNRTFWTNLMVVYGKCKKCRIQNLPLYQFQTMFLGLKSRNVLQSSGQNIVLRTIIVTIYVKNKNVRWWKKSKTRTSLNFLFSKNRLFSFLWTKEIEFRSL